jgi:hypothetical protein
LISSLDSVFVMTINGLAFVRRGDKYNNVQQALTRPLEMLVELSRYAAGRFRAQNS